MAKLQAAERALARGQAIPAQQQLGSLLHELQALVLSRRVDPAASAALEDLVQRIIRAAG